MSVLDQIEAINGLIDSQDDDLGRLLSTIRDTLVKFSQPLNTVYVVGDESCTEFDIVGLGNLFRGIGSRDENDTPVLFVDESAAQSANDRMKLVARITGSLIDLDVEQLRSVESAAKRARTRRISEYEYLK